MLGEAKITEFNTAIREGTTRYVNITCRSKDTGLAFDFDGYEIRTHLTFGKTSKYVQTAIVDNLVSYKIPADISVDQRMGIAETRIFKNGDVFEVLRVNITVAEAEKPDIVPGDNE